MRINPLLLCDGYKLDHRRQYPTGTTLVYSNFTPRASRNLNINKVVFFGLEYFIQEYLIRRFNEDFFQRPLKDVVEEYTQQVDAYLGPNSIGVDHIVALHKLGYLPVRIMAVPEGTAVPIRVAMLTIENTHPEFFWLTNALETILSNILWLPCTSATTSLQYLKKFNEYAEKTIGDKSFVPWQGHDFSFRGMSSFESSLLSGAAHLLSFSGTDTIPSITFLQRYYKAGRFVGGSVAATEHSTMCAGGDYNEFETFKRLITDIYPSGIVSIVSDTWDFWNVVTNFLPRLRDDILSRDGKVVIRPDSGDPVKIVVGDENAPEGSPERKGLIECLWDIFGGTTTCKNYKVLDSHIGAIYGDSITLERQNAILSGLEKKGFASSNIVLGIGSYTYQYVTRDTFGFAMKATYVEVNGQPRLIYKNPKTDDGTKKSAKGRLDVIEMNGNIQMLECVDERVSPFSILEKRFEDSKVFNSPSLEEIRKRITL